MGDIGFTQRVIEGEKKWPLGVRSRKAKSRKEEMSRKAALLWQRVKSMDRKSWRKTIVKTILALIVISMLTLLLLWFTLPNIDDPAAMFPAQSTVILDRNGVELYRLYSEQDRTYVAGDAISDYAKDATVAIEDERFFGRSVCFDFIGFTRASLSQIFPGLLVRSGGSTLTQQFAGNAFVGRKKSVIRKVRELMLACQLERRYDKDELLELYLNWIPYGQNAYGIEQASKNYFGISAGELSLAQSALLAALPQRPSYFSPYGKHVYTELSEEAQNDIVSGRITEDDQLRSEDITIGLIGKFFGSGTNVLYVGGRTDQVLRNMKNQGMITTEQEMEARSELQTMEFSPLRQNIRAPHFVLKMEKEIRSLLGIQESEDDEDVSLLEQGGFQITTTIDWELQEIAEKVVADRREDIATSFGAHNIALVALKPGTREVLAYVGNADFADDEHEGKIDMAAAPRQPGSSFKPFAYLAAFEQGYGPASVVYDVQTKFGTDTPANYDGTFWGPISVRQALGASRNIPAIKAFFLGGGEDSVLSVARRTGVRTPDEQKLIAKRSNPDYEYGWPLAIGAAEVPLSEMVQGYATIADGGEYRPMQTLLKVTDRDGNILYAPEEELSDQVIDKRLTAMITSILSDVSVRPNEYWKEVLSVPGVQTAAKTGTSNKCLERDKNGNCTLRRPESTWTIGYTPNLIAGVWAGNATSQSLFQNADGLTTAAPIWKDFMVGAHRRMEQTRAEFSLPEGLERPLISKLSGKLASECTPAELRTSDLFLSENVPTEEDPACAMLTIDKVTGLLASPECPVEAQEEGSFFVPSSELPNRWPLWEQGVQEWVTKEMEKWNTTENHSGSLLKLPVAPTDTCDPSLTPGRFDKPSVQILSPSDGDAVRYPSFVPVIRVQSAAPIKEIVFEIDGRPLRTVTSEPWTGNSVRIPRTIEVSGSHTLTVKLTNEYFTTAEDSVQFRFE